VLVRKPRVFVIPETKTGVLFCRSSWGGTLLVATWTFELVPSGITHRGTDMSPRYMGLVAASDEAASPERSEYLGRGWRGPLGCCGLARPATTPTYASSPSVGPRCWLLSVASSPVKPWAAGLSHRTDAQAKGDGWRARTGRPIWKTRQLSFDSLGATETRGRSEPHSRIRSDARGSKHSSR
jgi:hypothetical protein